MTDATVSRDSQTIKGNESIDVRTRGCDLARQGLRSIQHGRSGTFPS